MSDPLLLVENYFNTRIPGFAGHIVSADEESAGGEAFRVADGRRSSLDAWVPLTTNAQHWIRVQCPVSRAPTGLFLDRGHNLAGVANVKYQTSPDGSAWTDILTVTIPAVGSGGSDITAANGCSTEEGAWGITFGAPTARTYHRLLIPAMGTGLNPTIPGLWLGSAYLPGKFLVPWDEDQNVLHGGETASEWNWKGRSPLIGVRDGNFGIRLPDVATYTTTRYHLQQLFGRGRPMWICYDQAQADRSFLAIRPLGSHLTLGSDVTSFLRQARVDYEEHEALRPT